eukprot:m.92335 g.92335  ORF g.92335 m.92335 type:complete len:165 (-) comp13346_c0_seq2:346-840(-)
MNVYAEASVGTIYVFSPTDSPSSSSTSSSSMRSSASFKSKHKPQLDDHLAFALSSLFTDLGDFDDGLFSIRLDTFEPDTLWLRSILPRSVGTCLHLPGFCPYRPRDASVDQLGEVANLIKENIVDFDNNTLHGIGERCNNIYYIYIIALRSFEKEWEICVSGRV